MRGLVLGALMLVGCAGEAVGDSREALSGETMLLRCSGVLPGEEQIGFWYSTELVLEGDSWTAQETAGRVFVPGRAAGADGADGRVYVAFDWRGADNGGEFEMSPLGATLRIQYWDTDGNVEWSYPACFP